MNNMRLNLRANASIFLTAAALLLFATGLYQRVANPSLEYSLDAPTQTTGQTGPEANHEHPPLPPEETEKLNRAMAELQKKPNDANHMMSIAALFSRNKDWVNAIGFLERAATLAPSDMRPRYFLGMALASKGEFAKAAAAFENALAVAPGDASSRYNLAVLYRYHLNRPEEALVLFRSVTATPGVDAATKREAEKELGM